MTVKYMEKALINKIINFSNVDGPGNRMAIFVQHCPFHCLYCHNPETINLCRNCFACVKTCPVNALSIVDNKVVWDDKKCVNCDTCIKNCKFLSSPKVKYYTSEEIFNKVKEIKPFIRGITVSGGECTNYVPFLKELFQEIKKINLTCLLDSNGCYDMREFDDLIQLSNGVMLDVKAYSNDFHIKLTGSENKVVLNNLDYLLEINKLEEVRTVILPGFENENYNTVYNVSKLIKDKTKYKIIKYRHFGVRKEGLDVFKETSVSDSYMNELKDIALNNGVKEVIIR